MLKRHLSLWAVVALALCGVIGGGINVLIVEVQRAAMVGNLVPLIVLANGLLALAVAAVYGALASAMPEVGGEYLYIREGVGEKVASTIAFVKWAGMVIALGTVVYMDSAIAASAFSNMGMESIADFLRHPVGASLFSFLAIFAFWLLAELGLKHFGKGMIALALLMILGGLVIVYVGLSHSVEEWPFPVPDVQPKHDPLSLIYAAAILFWAYIGFTSITQSGSELEDAKRNLPKALILTTVLVSLYYFLYSYAFYHAVPWQALLEGGSVVDFIRHYAPSLSLFLTLFVFLALTNDIPAMLYTSSRLLYRWGKDGVVPSFFAEVNRRGSPHVALLSVAVLAWLVALFSAFGGLFTEVDVVVFSRFLLYALVALALLRLPKVKPTIYKRISFLTSRPLQVFLSLVVVAVALIFGAVIFYKELSTPLLLNPVVQTVAFLALGYVLLGRGRPSAGRLSHHP